MASSPGSARRRPEADGVAGRPGGGQPLGRAGARGRGRGRAGRPPARAAARARGLGHIHRGALRRRHGRPRSTTRSCRCSRTTALSARLSPSPRSLRARSPRPRLRALMAERRLHGLERVLGVNALFSTAYGNVGSSIYYALGLVASFALGLTPVVFVITGVDLLPDRRDLLRGDRDVPGGGRLVELRAPRLQRVLVVLRRVGPDAQLRRSRSRSRRSSCRTTSAGCSGSRCATGPATSSSGSSSSSLLAVINVFGVKEAARLNILLAVVDFATQLLLVLLGVVLVFSPETLIDNVDLRRRADVEGLPPRDPGRR